MALSAPTGRTENAQTSTATPDFGESVTVLIDLADHLSAGERQDFLAAVPGATLNSEFSEEEGLYRVTLPTAEALALVGELRGMQEIEFVEPEHTYALEAIEAEATRVDDPLYQFQWHLDQIHVEDAWNQANGDGAVVAVIDTGVAFADSSTGLRQVRDLSGTSFVPGYDFVSDDDQPHDEHGHGTHVAGTIAQTTNNGYGVAGIAPGAAIMPIRVLDASGRGSTADIAESIRWAADNGAHVINMSLGGPLPSRIMQDAVAYAHRKGVTIIAAAGNSGWSMPSFPAAYPNVVAVSATQFDRDTTFYSNYGRYIDIAAPGGNTQLDQNDDGRPDGVMQETLTRENPAEHEFALYMGTSMASPHVAGVAALIHQQGITHPDRVEEMLQASSTQDVPDYTAEHYGAGLLDAGAATRANVVKFQAPRAALALFLVMLGLSTKRTRRSGIAGASTGIAAVFGATGLAALVFLGSTFGLSLGALGGFAASPIRWLDNLGFDCVGSSLLILSAGPSLLLYGLFGGLKSPRAAGVVVGLLSGLAAFLVGETVVATMDVGGIPGMGVLDRVWLGTNAMLATLIALLAFRRSE
ncbi:MAG: serine protease [Bradymonadia bacterium]|jgi:serine protease